MNYKGCRRKLLFHDLSYCSNICVTELKISYKLRRSWWAVSWPRFETDTFRIQVRISTGYVNLLAVKTKICHILRYTVLFPSRYILSLPYQITFPNSIFTKSLTLCRSCNVNQGRSRRTRGVNVSLLVDSCTTFIARYVVC